MLVLGLVNDWLGMWIGHVLQRVRLQGRDPLAVGGGHEGGGFGGSWVASRSGWWGCLKEIVSGGV